MPPFPSFGKVKLSATTSSRPTTEAGPSSFCNSASKADHGLTTPRCEKSSLGRRCRVLAFCRLLDIDSGVTCAARPEPMSDIAEPNLEMGFATPPTRPLPMPTKKPPTPSCLAPSMGFLHRSAMPSMPWPSERPASTMPSPMLWMFFASRISFCFCTYWSSKVSLETKLAISPAIMPKLSAAYEAAAPPIFNGTLGRLSTELLPSTVPV
mmetsp:Transcript_3499/g.7681  ORF Transcript_3499/g.7681 Transcript_3499/m.7681 type:complete len:209 (-) Transcript_3499:351-977(-)